MSNLVTLDYRYKLIAIILLTVMVSACAVRQTPNQERVKAPDKTPELNAARPAPPSWVGGDLSSYPSALYLVGTGVAATESQARDLARSEIAKIFTVQIDESSSDRVEVRQNQQEMIRESSVSRLINTRVNEVIEGIEIQSVWHDRAAKTYHALAILRRNRAAHSLQDQILPLDRQIEDYIGRAKGLKEGDLLRVVFLQRAYELAVQRAGLQRLLRVLDLSGKGVTAKIAVAGIRAKLDEAVSLVAIRPVVSSCPGRFEQGLKEGLSGGIGRAGFKVSTHVREGLMVRANLEMDNVFSRSGLNWIRGRLVMIIKSIPEGRYIGVHRWSIKQSGVNLKETEHRVLDDIHNKLTGQFRSLLINMLENSLSKNADEPIPRTLRQDDDLVCGR